MTRTAFLAPLVLLFASVGCDDPCGGCAEGAFCDEAAAVCRCGSLDGPACEAGDSCDAARAECVAPMPAAVCGAGTRWSSGQTAFVESTSTWGLDALGVEGVRLSVTDIDGDGWADLEVRRGSLAPENFADGPRRTWLLRNTGSGTFEDVTESSGFLSARQLDGLGRPVQIVAWGDVDNDGDLDVYHGLSTSDLEASGGETSELLLNDGTGHFSLSGEDNPVRRVADVDSPAGASFVDVDHDGLLDLWVPVHNTSAESGRIYLWNDHLWRGDGTGRLADANAAMGIITSDWTDSATISAGLGHTRAWSANACDLDGDGYAELLASSYGRSPNHLWQSSGGGAYTNRSVESGYAYDGDMSWEDNQFARCFCQSERTAEGCADVPAPVVSCSANWNHDSDREAWRLGGNSGATICADIDNDGDIDLLTTEIRHWWAGLGADGSELLINDGTATFERPGDAALGLAIEQSSSQWDEGHMTGALFDFDNDGWTDVYVGGSDYAGNRGLLYHQESPLAFAEVGPSEGIDHNRSHGVVVADFDRDGDLDVVVGHSRARCDPSAPNDCYATSQVRFFENVAGDGGNFVQVVLEGGAGTNRAAIGARVRVTAAGVTQTQEVGGGHGHYGSQNDRVLHFGLGSGCEAEVEIRWPDAAGTTETFTLPAGHRFLIWQGGQPVLQR